MILLCVHGIKNNDDGDGSSGESIGVPSSSFYTKIYLIMNNSKNFAILTSKSPGGSEPLPKQPTAHFTFTYLISFPCT